MELDPDLTSDPDSLTKGIHHTADKTFCARNTIQLARPFKEQNSEGRKVRGTTGHSIVSQSITNISA